MKVKLIKINDKIYPNSLKLISKPPQSLYLLGNEENLNNSGIAIIGSRNYTEYGKKYALKFSKELAKQGINIISGMALGIDRFAHEGALNVGGNTIAVLGSGFNHIYPEENIDLFNLILKNNGTIISEYPPNVKPDSKNFPERNRIVSGLANGVLVIEGGYRSGTSITAKLALTQGKKLFCLPSNLDRKNGIGTNKLIKEGAKLVTCIEDIMEEMGFEKVNYKFERKIPDKYLKIYNAIEEEQTNINIIYKKVNLSINEINTNLLLMEIEGYIKSLPGNFYKKVIE